MALLAGPNVTVYNLYKQQISPLEARENTQNSPFELFIIHTM